ncbi:response regulator transcription factor [Allokutzneria sp. A3M-2-11 16]|uniref:response regulator transcription factor n=1 Tax=Allokutzneria sp. A3M-2-11 16 TaxID=2962043 RepID=UPI0020B660AE|nr:response regulator transcription factor [Allokutzneria sp. A3M-2-11 16]MCP3804485.1 response regulator transcription factor [Allokutzneria sp. A3M-2-11 16]
MVQEVRIRLCKFSPIFEYGLGKLLGSVPGFQVVVDRGVTRPGHVDIVCAATADVGAVVRMSSRARVLVMTDSCEAEDAQRYFLAGALGCVNASAPLRTVVEAVQRVARGQRFLATDFGVPAPVGPGGGNEELSPREAEVLSHIANGRTHDQIARTMGISRHTVDTYVKRVRKKLSLGNKAELTRAAISSQLALSRAR